MIFAILQAQWRSMRMFRTGARQASAAFSAITGLLFYGFWAAIAFALHAFFAAPENQPYFLLAMSYGLLLVFLYWQIAPIITASMGASLDLKKLLVYPVPHQQLFLVEVLLRLTTSLEMIIVLIGIVTGLFRNPQLGGFLSLPRLFWGFALFLSMNLLLSAGLRSLLERILLRKGLREFFFFLLFMVSVVPQVLLTGNRLPSTLPKNIPDVYWLPWSAAGHVLLGSKVFLCSGITVLFTAIFYWFGRSQFERNLRIENNAGEVAAGSALHAGSSWKETLLRLPSRIFPDPIAAIMEKELRSLFRIPSFRMIFLMSAIFGLLLWLPHHLRTETQSKSFFSDNAVTFAMIYGVLMLGQVTYFNCFGFDRSAVQAWFSVPVSITRVLIAKNLTVVVFVLLDVVLVSLTGFVMKMNLNGEKLVEVVCVGLLAALYLVSFGNVASVRFPRALNPDKLNQGGSAKAINALILVFFPVVLLPIGLAYWGREVFESNLVFFGLLALAAVLGGVLYWVSLTSAAASAYQQRETLLTELSRGEGPVSLT